jgi:2-polyprenyl-3-methyl-5-hydroxy-6-metoxy-1,4-benzoquinol methylase
MGLSQKFPIRKTRVVSRVPNLLQLCNGKKVLHIGCADMPYTLDRGEDLLHKRLAKVVGSDDLWGVDYSAEGIEALRAMGFNNLIHGDIQALGSQLKEMRFDVILFCEVIEHLDSPGEAVESCVSIMAGNTELIITTPNATSVRGFVNSFFRIEKVHPDHNYYFSFRTIKHLLEKHGLVCNEVYYYQEVEGTGVSWVFDQILSLGSRLTPPWADGVIARAVKHR